jgi:hypothetical protein
MQAAVVLRRASTDNENASSGTARATSWKPYQFSEVRPHENPNGADHPAHRATGEFHAGPRDRDNRHRSQQRLDHQRSDRRRERADDRAEHRAG